MYVIVDIGIMVYCTNFSLDHILLKKPILEQPLNIQLNLYRVILFDIFKVSFLTGPHCQFRSVGCRSRYEKDIAC
jgi:hypothetical protein